eukprot:scaffold37078_cov117-Cyclotella_meneghiniana.AAC.2
MRRRGGRTRQPSIRQREAANNEAANNAAFAAAIAGVGNPTRSNAISKLIKNMKRMQTRRIGVPSRCFGVCLMAVVMLFPRRGRMRCWWRIVTWETETVWLKTKIR